MGSQYVHGILWQPVKTRSEDDCLVVETCSLCNIPCVIKTVVPTYNIYILIDIQAHHDAFIQASLCVIYQVLCNMYYSIHTCLYSNTHQLHQTAVLIAFVLLQYQASEMS